MPPVNSTAISAWEPGLPWTRYFGVIGNTPRSMAMFWPRSESMNSTKASAALGRLEPARMPIGSGVIHAGFVAPKTAWITPEPIGILAGSKRPRAALAFVEFMLSERGQNMAMERGVFPITPKYRVQGKPGSQAEMAVEFTGGIRSYFDVEVTNIYDDDKAQARYEQINSQFRREIESVAEELKRK